MFMAKLFRGAILGGPASGKGTISSRIIDKYDVVHISTGNIFRKNINNPDPLWKSVERYMKEGKLVPDILVMRIMMERLKELENESWLCDGFPRTLIQAEKMFMSYPLNVVFNLNVPVEVLIERAKGRWVHVGSGRVYHTDFSPPKVPGIDDVTGEPLVQRSDDKPEAIKARLKIYADTVEPLLEFYKKKGILKVFTGKTSNEIWPRVDDVMRQFLSPKS